MPDPAAITIVPANRASCEDLHAIFGRRGDAAHCQCQHYKIRIRDWHAIPREAREMRLHQQTGCGRPRDPRTSGLVAYLDGIPAGWCACGPRPAFPRLIADMRTPWAGRDEDRDAPDVWAAVCFLTRAGYRRRGVSRALAAATIGFARERGARALEGYPMIPRPGRDAPWGELHVGTRSIFAAAGFREASRPSPRRAVMRMDF